jgi:hypothetical protein
MYLKYLLFLSYFNYTLIISTDFSKLTQISNFTKIRPEGAEFFHVNGQTDTHDEANSRGHLQTSRHIFTVQRTHPLKHYQSGPRSGKTSLEGRVYLHRAMPEAKWYHLPPDPVIAAFYSVPLTL